MRCWHGAARLRCASAAPRRRPCWARPRQRRSCSLTRSDTHRGPVWPQIEALFIDRRSRPPDVESACVIAAAAIGAPLPAALEAGLDDLAAFASLDGTEPAYHGRHHFAEAAMAMGWLCAHAHAAGAIDPAGAACGVMAMAGHDLLHDGSMRLDGALEARSAAAVDPVLAATGVGPAERARIQRLILATDPARALANAAALQAAPQDTDALLAVLANEADLAASLMPDLGPRLGALLAEEWRKPNPAAAANVASHAGRLAFLRGVPALTPYATALGLAAARDACLAAYASLGPTEDAGAARLDAMPIAEAADAYTRAVPR